MKTLGRQPEKPQYCGNTKTLDLFLQDAIGLAKKHNVSIDVVINAKYVLELERQNKLNEN